MTAYFVRTGPTTYRATRHTQGAWDLETQHVAAALGLLAHAVEVDRDRRRGSDLVLGRVSYDILGTMPVAEVEVAVRVIRPGRTIELVEATMSAGGRVGVLLRAWLMMPGETAALAGSEHASIPGPDQAEVWPASTIWPGGFIETVEVRRIKPRPGRAAFWVRTPIPLVDESPLDEAPASRVASIIGLLDIANGMSVRVSPTEALFPNIDLTAHLFRAPQGEWVGFDTTVSFGPEGLGLTSSVLHDLDGPFGSLNQMLTVRPRR